MQTILKPYKQQLCGIQHFLVKGKHIKRFRLKTIKRSSGYYTYKEIKRNIIFQIGYSLALRSNIGSFIEKMQEYVLLNLLQSCKNS